MFPKLNKKTVITSIIPIVFGIIVFTFGLIWITQITQTTDQKSRLVYYINDELTYEEISELEYYDSELLTLEGQGMINQHEYQIKSLRYSMIGLFSLTLVVIVSIYLMILKYTNHVEKERTFKLEQTKRINESKIYHNKRDIYLINRYLSHELKNSLAVLQGKIYLDTDDVLSFVGQMSRQIDDINALTLQELTKYNLVNLNNVFVEVQNQLPQSFIVTGLKNPEIMGSNLLLEHAFYNIIENAYKYGAQNVEVEFKQELNNIVCIIRNDGPPISAKHIDHIFNFEYRINPLNKNGSGIGLALVKNIVDLHYGSIYVESDNNKTEFYLSFRQINNKEN